MRNRPSPRAFTLLELLLVLALLSIIAAVTWPAVQGPLQSMRLQKAADQVRTAWAEARNEAMTTGQIHAFQFDINRDSYRLAPWNVTDTDLDSSDSFDTSLGPVRDFTAPRSLPQGVIFLRGQFTGDDQPASDTLPRNTPSPATATSLTSIAFYPDGTTSDVEVVLQNERYATLTLSLRGLTGTAHISPLQTEE